MKIGGVDVAGGLIVKERRWGGGGGGVLEIIEQNSLL